MSGNGDEPTVYPQDLCAWTPLQLTTLVLHVTDLLAAAPDRAIADPTLRQAIREMTMTSHGRLASVVEAE